MSYPSRLIQVFLKSPIPGKVKTRLIPDLGIDRATTVHLQLVERTLATINQCEADIECWVAGDFDHPYIQEMAGGFVTKAQIGTDLGERMHHAMLTGIQKHRYVVLVGADAYSLTPEYIDEAFTHLKDNDVVLGPAQDGGYILVGAKLLHPLMFNDIDWGTSSVLQEQIENLEKCGLSYHLLPAGFDIDELQDIKAFAPELLK